MFMNSFLVVTKNALEHTSLRARDQQENSGLGTLVFIWVFYGPTRNITRNNSQHPQHFRPMGKKMNKIGGFTP